MAESFSPIEIRLGRSLAPSWPTMADGRAVVIDYFASRRCGVTVGDLTCRLAQSDPKSSYVELDPIWGVQVLAEPHLLGVLAKGAELRLGGPVFARRLVIGLDDPACWLGFLEQHPATHRAPRSARDLNARLSA